jgi:hypothetical protein
MAIWSLISDLIVLVKVKVERNHRLLLTLYSATINGFEIPMLEQAAQRSGVNSEKLLYWDARTNNTPGVNSEKLRTQV